MICISSFITVPIPPLPVTLQLLAVFLVLGVLGGRVGSGCVLLYLAIGAMGLPVFSGFSGGVGRLFDVGGGFLLGFLLGSVLYWVLDLCLPAFKFKRAALFCVILLAVHLSGVLWYALVYSAEGSVLEGFMLLSLPYLPMDLVKLLAAALMSEKLSRTKIIKNS